MQAYVLVPCLGLALSLTHGTAEAQASSAALLTGVSPAHCVASLERREAPDPLRCPSALHAATAEAQTLCRDAGGRLSGATEGAVWAIDVNEDGRSELAFELDGNLTCSDAWSIFACGSAACSKTLYELRDRAWTAVGSIAAQWPEQLTLGSARAADGHRSLEVCARQDCAERWTYEWQGESYDTTRVEVSGTRVDIAGSLQGLHPLAAEITVRAAPRASGTDLGRYPAGSDVAVVGTAGDWYYVSPCNACERGFVPRAAVAPR
jgi:hypothetical protein